MWRTLTPSRLTMPAGHGQQLLLLSLGGLVPALLFVALYGRPERLVRFFPDDAFYYLQVAWTAAHDGRVSFDGRNVTTGFHPLFFASCVLLATLASKAGVLVLVFVLNGLALTATLQMLFATLTGPIGARSLATTAGMLPLFTMLLWTSSGLESAVVLPVAAVFGAVWLGSSRDAHSSWRWGLGIGTCAALLCLARLDLVIALGPFAIYLLARNLRYRQLGHLSSAVLGYAAVIGPYCLWNIWLQGNVIPTSAIVKLTLQHSLVTNWRALTFGNSVGVVLFLVPLVLNLLALFKRVYDEHEGRYVALLSLSALLYLGYVLFLGKGVFRWYLAYLVFGSLVALVVLVRWLADHVRLPDSWAFRLVFAALVGACNMGFFIGWSHQETVSVALWRMTNELNVTVPANARLATVDAGVVGYFGRFKVFALDGLVNSLENWRRYLSHGDIAGYVRAEGVEYLLMPETEQPQLDEETVVVPGRVELILGSDQLLGRHAIAPRFTERLYRLKPD